MQELIDHNMRQLVKTWLCKMLLKLQDMNLLNEIRNLKEDLGRMEEEKQNFTRLMKDARKRFEDLLTNLEKSKPFLVPRSSRKYLTANGDVIANEASTYMYRRMSCRGENSDENISMVKVTKGNFCSNRQKVKKRFRHSVIGTGKEFRDFQYVLLNEASEYEAYCDAVSEDKLPNGDVLGNCTNPLYSSDKKMVANKLNISNSKTSSVNHNEIFGMKFSSRDVCCTKTFDDNFAIRKSFSHELRRAKRRKNCRSSYIARSRRASPEQSIYTDDCLVLTREQKRRVKEKMKLAMKRPNNYSYLGNL